jgi:HD-GYP domain-containing protein (c-di-GMP phosphodiesterase class II)
LSEILNGCRNTVEAMVDLLKTYDTEKIQLLISNLSFHDFYTYDHSINVSMYCISLYRSVKPNASREQIVMAGLAGMFHDIGKLKISTEIINKPNVLDVQERQLINQHPQIGFDLLNNNTCNCQGINFEILKRVVFEHHESYNGKGYPNKLKGTDIYFLARITTIADFFDAITTKRSYHDALNVNEAMKVMNFAIGKKLDPKFFKLFSKNVDQLIFKEKLNTVLTDDFDPCQPHNVLPLKKTKVSLNNSEVEKKNSAKDHGRIIRKAG